MIANAPTHQPPPTCTHSAPLTRAFASLVRALPLSDVMCDIMTWTLVFVLFVYFSGRLVMKSKRSPIADTSSSNSNAETGGGDRMQTCAKTLEDQPACIPEWRVARRSNCPHALDDTDGVKLLYNDDPTKTMSGHSVTVSQCGTYILLRSALLWCHQL